MTGVQTCALPIYTAGNWIYTPGEMCRRSPKSSYQHVDERNYVEVSQGWVKQLRYGPMVPSDRGYVPLMKLTAKERLWCCSDAMSAHPPNFNVELVEGDSPPAWDTGQPYSIGDGWGGSIPTEIYITVGKGYVQNIRDHAAQEKN